MRVVAVLWGLCGVWRVFVQGCTVSSGVVLPANVPVKQGAGIASQQPATKLPPIPGAEPQPDNAKKVSPRKFAAVRRTREAVDSQSVE